MRHAPFATRMMIFSMVLAGLGSSFAPASAKLAPFDGIGGSGGTPFRLDCGESCLLIGITGRSGVVIDQVGGLCVKIDPISDVWVGGSYETLHYGGSGGQSIHIAASKASHEETLIAPIAIAVIEEGQDDTLHLVLVLSNGQALTPVKNNEIKPGRLHMTEQVATWGLSR